MRLACLTPIASPLTVRPVSPLEPLDDAYATEQPVGAVRPPSPDARTATVAGVDLGTTTIAATLAGADGLPAGEPALRANPQSAFGADVASRVEAALEGEGPRLAQAARDAVARSLGDACGGAGACLERIERVAVAANTVMAHLLVGADVSGLAEHPYAPSWTGPRVTSAGELGLRGFDASCEVYVVPAFGAFVGGDLAAGVVGLGLDQPGPVRVLLDMGTNAEVAVAAGERLVVASAPAGPAFEAVGIGCGGPMAIGAVDEVTWDEGFSLRTIGEGAEPSWLCGSGLLTAMTALRRAGLLDETGKLAPTGTAGAVFETEDGVRAVPLEGPSLGRGLFITQLDVREVQLAKAALAAALGLALERADVSWTDVADVYIAGAFGRSMPRGALAALGILPPGGGAVVHARADAALLGAALIAADADARARAERAVTAASVLDLPGSAAFEQRFLSGTAFPPLPG